MEDTLVSYNTALLAKEVGFDSDYVIQCYRKNGNVTLYSKQAHTHCTSVGKSIFENFDCLAPTQSLLSKWLRVKYNYNINVKHITHNQKYGFSVTGNYDEKTGGIIIPYNFKGYDSYEECLENALQQCLNIIKNNI